MVAGLALRPAPEPHLMSEQTLRPQRRRSATQSIAATIFVSRWLQAPLYLGLIVAQGVYVVQFMRELWHIVTHMGSLDESHPPLHPTLPHLRDDISVIRNSVSRVKLTIFQGD